TITRTPTITGTPTITRTFTNTPVPINCGPLINFAPVVNYPVGYRSRSLAVGEFNGDGHPDLVDTSSFTGYGSVKVLFGRADGTFQLGDDYFVGDEPHTVLVGDFN